MPERGSPWRLPAMFLYGATIMAGGLAGLIWGGLPFFAGAAWMVIWGTVSFAFFPSERSG